MILSCGEALIDMLPRSTADGATVFQPFIGGSPFNTAIALGRLGAPAGFFGAMLKAALDEGQVDASLAILTDRPTTLAFVALVNGNARYAFYDENSAGRLIIEADLPDLPARVAALHFSAVSLVQEPCGSAFETLMTREAGKRVTSLDPNVRPTLVKDPDAFRRRIGRMAAMADIIKLSEDDLAWLAPGAAFETIAEKWFGTGTRLAILTRGAAGAVALTRNLSLAIPGIAVPVADTVGAGDTFTAGLLARLNQRGLLSKASIATLTEENLVDTIAFAVRAATITVSRPGADPPWRRELGD